MKKDQFTEVIENLKLPKNEWITLAEIESILLSDGRGIYPNWRHIRFQILDDSILIQHGDSEPYGARLGSMFNVSSDRKQLSFPPSSIVVPSEYYGTFRNPKSGDIVRATNGCDSVISECLIEKVISTANAFVIILVNPIKLTKEFRLSFYDPADFDSKMCMHSSEVEGIYMKFSGNNGKQRKLGVFHEIIKSKEINEIKLKLSVKNKTYTIRG